jgi:hypothetical protein
MIAFEVIYFVAFLFSGGVLLMGTGSGAEQGSLISADSLFRAGKFAEAEKVYSSVLAEDPGNFQAILRLGNIALLSQRLDDAQKWLSKALEIEPEEAFPKSLLAEVFCRRDDFQRAAPLLRAAGRDAAAAKLESFKGQVPYQIEGTAAVTRLKFEQTDPLPLIRVRVNGSEEAYFFIDTGASEIDLDPEFADQVKALRFGSEMGTFGGGRKASYDHGRIDSLTLGDVVVKNVPIHILATRRFSPIFGGKRIDGILGTVMLYHFFPTIDYVGGELVLRRKTSENVVQLAREVKAERQTVVPFWMAGDHYAVAWGTVNRSKPLLFFVDLGLAGGGFTCPASTIQEGGITLSESQAGEGIGGGGKVRIVPFVVGEMTLGDLTKRNTPGLFGAFPPSLEYAFGFRIGGLISHAFFRSSAITMDFDRMNLYLR